MRKTHHIVDEQEIMRFNLRRENNAGKTFSTAEFKELIRKMGYSDNANFISCITRGVNPPFKRIERGKYAFNPIPVHISRLQTVWDEYADYGKKSPKSDTESLTTVATEAEINAEKAIAFLKKMGYRILKPITNWEEV
jgi:hypothetical protein